MNQIINFAIIFNRILYKGTIENKNNMFTISYGKDTKVSNRLPLGQWKRNSIGANIDRKGGDCFVARFILQDLGVIPMPIIVKPVVQQIKNVIKPVEKVEIKYVQQTTVVNDEVKKEKEEIRQAKAELWTRFRSGTITESEKAWGYQHLDAKDMTIRNILAVCS